MSIPTFTSFPPSFDSFPDFDEENSLKHLKKSELSETKRKRSHRDRKEKNGDHERKRTRRKEHRDRDRHSQKTYKDDETIKAEDDRKKRAKLENRSPLFFSDRTGDPLIVQYGGLHSGDVPKHHLVAGGRRILGLGKAWLALHRTGKSVEVGVHSRNKGGDLTNPATRNLLALPPTRRILSGDTSYKYPEVDGFLRLPSRRGRKGEQDYRSITVSKDVDNSESDSSGPEVEVENSEESDSETDVPSAHQETLRELEANLARNPKDIDSWLSLLAHSLSVVPLSSKNATKARSEISLAILNRALSAHPSNRTSVSLLTRHLRAGEEVWHESTLRAEWEDALKVGDAEIWMGWLEWRIRKGGKGIGGVVEDAKRLINDSRMDEVAKIRAFWRAGVVLQQAGYFERAIAMFQAQAELTFRLPEALRSESIEKQLDELEEFWDSEVPRVGEENSKGWSAWESSGRPEHNRTPNHQSPLNNGSEIVDPFRRWCSMEIYTDRTKRRPTRSSENAEDVDPYTTVLFSDIRSMLFEIKSARAKDAFRKAWLAVLGLHIPGFAASLSDSPSENADDRWSETQLTSAQYISSIFPVDSMRRQITADAYAGVIVGRERQYSSGFGPVKSWGYGVFGPLEGGGGEVGTHGLWEERDFDGVDKEMVKNVFAQLRGGTEEDWEWEWDTLAVAFEVAMGHKSALKLSRSLLSSKRNSLPHWAAHARLERLRGRNADSRKVYEASLTSPSRLGAGQMWWEWAEMEWLDGRAEDAIKVVCRSVSVEGRGGVAVLRTKRELDERISATPTQRWKERECWVKLRILLDFLTGSPNNALLEVDSRLRNISKAGEIPHESLTTSCLLMLYQHSIILKNPTPPVLLRDRVQSALETYPNNSAIFGLFLECQKGQGIWGRVRSALGDGDTTKSVARRVWEVWVAAWEKGRWESEVERTRAGLGAAVESESTRGSAILWRIFIEFEIRAGQLDRAKSLLFRAIGECPFSKDLYLMAFGALRGTFDGHELSDFADIMSEREIRMRTSLDLAEGYTGGKDSGIEDRAEDDEIEFDARELRRLMPY